MTDTTDTPTVTPDPDRDGVILHLPEITYLDTQTWAVDVGLTTEGLAALRTLLGAPADRAAVLAEAIAVLDRRASAVDALSSSDFGEEARAVRELADAANELRRMADEAPAAEKLPDEDPARIDRFRPEFTEHASVESIDVQLRRARAQQRRWHLRAEWLISLRATRVAQKERGEWPAAAPQDGARP